jgi:hypothetical protein
MGLQCAAKQDQKRHLYCRVQTRRVPLTIVFRYREIGGILCTKG